MLLQSRSKNSKDILNILQLFIFAGGAKSPVGGGLKGGGLGKLGGGLGKLGGGFGKLGGGGKQGLEIKDLEIKDLEIKDLEIKEDFWEKLDQSKELWQKKDLE